MSQCRIDFEAIHPEANIFRQDSIWIGKDLFGYTVIDTHWGRKGRPQSQDKRYAYEFEDEAKKFALLTCRKRLKATRRIGGNYKCIPHDLNLENLSEEFEALMGLP